MSCMRCNREYGDIEITLTDACAPRTYCPNCLVVALCEGELDLVNNPNWYDDVSNKRPAIEYRTKNEIYMLEYKRLIRLISRRLLRREWFALVNKYGCDKYMLHSDFYADDGTPLQPIKSLKK